MQCCHRTSCSPLVLCVALAAASGLAAEPDAAGIEFFESKIRPLLAENCYKCHSHEAPKLKGKFYLDSLEGLVAGGESGPALVPGDPAKSSIIEAVSYKNTDLQMPPKTKLSDAQVALLTEWVKRGAPWPKKAGAGSGESQRLPPNVDAAEFEKRRQHWAFQPVLEKSPPPVQNTAWPKGVIDVFVLAKLEEKSLPPTAPADKRTLIRRATFDLIGLPPTPEQVEAFVRDGSPDAFANVVDGLLASPHFGERWGRHWLDLVRYGESRGHEFDHPIPNPHEYRDYVIRAFNADVPYNQFVREHLAGDLISPPRLNPVDGFNESILGTGFWFLGEAVHSPVDIRQDSADRFDNMVDVTCKAFLGLTVACARCHDHKFDPILSKDYYALFGFLQSSNYRLAPFDTMEHNRAVAQELWKLRADSAPLLAKEAAQAMRPQVERMGGYLLAAREALAAQPEFDPSESKRKGKAAQRGRNFSAAYLKRVAEIARERKLEPALLADWAACLLDAGDDARDLLHVWAKVSSTKSGAKDWKTITAPLLESARKQDAAAAEILNTAGVVVDYANIGIDDWHPDGVSFGSGPLKIGCLALGRDAAHPIEKIVETPAAEFDPAWSGLKPAPGVAIDPVGLAYMRAGRTLCTPRFTVAGGKIYFLARGTGRAYAAVDKHALIGGPLHGHLIKKFESKTPGAFEWYAMELSPYKEHRAHVEFTGESADFAIAKVIQSDKAPPLQTLRALLSQAIADAGSPEALAKSIHHLMTEALGRLEFGKFDGNDGADYAALANWLIAHPELSGGRAGEAGKSFAEVQAKILGRIKNESRLAMAMMDVGCEDEYVMKRGLWKNRGENAPRQLLEAIAGNEQPKIARGSGRLELANRMSDPANPFITRVMVNRLWHHLFGRGIVPSVDNFGILGQHDAPLHKDLLDCLAGEFVKQGWSVKKMIREMMLSSSYQMASTSTAAADEKDPDNQFLHRMNIRRLEGEVIRDSILAVSGRLDEKMYGRSVPILLDDFLQGRGRPGSGPVDGNGRRSIYLSVTRNFLSPMMMAFDTPIPFNTMGRRSVSNVPAQALILMNDPMVVQQAQVWAKRILSVKGLSPEQRVAKMYLAAYARPPLEAETAAALAFLDRQAQELGIEPAKRRDDERAWADLAHVLMNYKEFIYVN